MNLMKELKTYIMFLLILTISSLGGAWLSTMVPFEDPTFPMVGAVAVIDSAVAYIAYKAYFKKQL